MRLVNFTEKYILLNILVRKNIQVLKLDNIEKCCKKNISGKKFLQKIWKINSLLALFSQSDLKCDRFCNLILQNIDNSPK